MTIKINSKTFSGAANLHNGTLAAVIIGMAQHSALSLAAGLDSFTADESTGTAGETLAAIDLPTGYTTAGTDLFPKAGAEAALETIVDGVSTVLEQANTIATVVGSTSAIDNTGGTSGEGTIAAITKTTNAVTGPSGNSVSFETGIKTLSSIRNLISQTASIVNASCVATGIAPLLDQSGGDGGSNRSVFDVVSVDTGDGGDGLDNTGISKADGDAFLSACADAVATLAAKLDEITGATVGAPAVVAV